jgi:uncharacterized protein YcnI
MSKASFAIAALVLAASPASAHISLEPKQATIGSSYKAVFAVPHGCAGSATIKIRVQIPEGVIGAKPMPKAGWNVEAISGKYASEYDYHGSKLTEGVKEGLQGFRHNINSSSNCWNIREWYWTA